jgi:hypothetical protein
MAVTTVFWNVTLFSLVEFADLSDQRAESINRIHDIYYSTLEVKAVLLSSEKST